MRNRSLKTRTKARKREGRGGNPEPEALIDGQLLLSRVKELVAPLCEYEGLELVQVECQRESRGKILRLYIDRCRGVTLDDCAHISRQVGDLLDVEIGETGSYSLEVSSPGPDRPVSSERDFARFEGKAIHIKTVDPIDGRKSFKGVLLGLSSGNVELMIEDKTVAIPYPGIRKARLIPHLDG